MTQYKPFCILMEMANRFTEKVRYNFLILPHDKSSINYLRKSARRMYEAVVANVDILRE